KIVDIFFCVILAHTDANAGVGYFGIQSDAVEHMRGLQGPRGAGGSVGYADPFHIQVQEQHFPVKSARRIWKSKVDNMRHSLIGGTINLVAIAEGTVKSAYQAISQGVKMGGMPVHLSSAELQCFRQSHYTGYIQRTAAASPFL